MYPWSRPYVPHAARPLQAHPLSTNQPASQSASCTCIRASMSEDEATVCMYRYIVVVVIYRFAIAAVCFNTPTCYERVSELCANIIIVSRVYICVCSLKSGAQNSIEMYRITTKLRKLRFSLRETAINFSQPGVVSPPFLLSLRIPSRISRRYRRRIRADKIYHLSRAILPRGRRRRKGSSSIKGASEWIDGRSHVGVIVFFRVLFSFFFFLFFTNESIKS